MKKQEVRDTLYQSLQTCLPSWKLVKKDEAFVRPIAGGVQKIFVSLVDYNPEFRFSLTFATRIDRVEEILNRDREAPAAIQKQTVTSMTQLDYFFPGEPKPKRFSVRTVEDIRAAVASLRAVLQTDAPAFMDSHADIASLDRAMNGGDPGFDTSDPTYRSIHALILARLAGNPHFEQLAASYQAAISHFPDISKRRLSHVIDSLRSLQT